MDTYAQTIRLERRLELTHPSLTGLVSPSPSRSSEPPRCFNEWQRVRPTEEGNCCIPSLPAFHTRRASARSSVNADEATSRLPRHRRAAWSWVPALTPSTCTFPRTELKPFGCTVAAGGLGARCVRPCVWSLLPWIAPLPSARRGKPSEPEPLESPFQAPDAGWYPGASAGLGWEGLAQWPTADTGHRLPSYLGSISKHLRFPAGGGCDRPLCKGERETKHVRKNAEGVSGRRGTWSGVVCLCKL